MSELWDVVQRYVDSTGATPAALARLIGVSRQVPTNWRYDRIRGLPRPSVLRALADVTGEPYDDVLNAALADAGYLDKRPKRTVDLRATGLPVGLRRPAHPHTRR